MEYYLTTTASNSIQNAFARAWDLAAARTSGFTELGLEHMSNTQDTLGVLDLPIALGAVIDGTWILPDAADRIAVEDPATTAILTEVIDSDDDLVDAAVRSADKTYREIWRRTAPAERGRILVRIAAILRREAETLARIETLDTGKPLRQARGDVETAARYFEFYGGMADKILGETLPQPRARSRTRFVSRSGSSATSRPGTRRSTRCPAASHHLWRRGTRLS